MRNEHNTSEHNERISQESLDVDTSKQKSIHMSNIPPRASAHPSALAAVRPKYPRSASDQERITPFDGITSNPLELTRLAQRKTEDLPSEPIFYDRGDIVPIDEIDTRPPDAPAQLRARSQVAAYEPISLIDTLPTSSIQGKQAGAYPSSTTQSRANLPHDVRPVARPRGFSLERCVDNVRWWLLFPGRLEFVLWLVGAIALVLLTSFFLLIIASIWTR